MPWTNCVAWAAERSVGRAAVASDASHAGTRGRCGRAPHRPRALATQAAGALPGPRRQRPSGHDTGRIAAAAPTPSPRASLGAQLCTYASFARARHAPADCAVHPAARPVHGKQYVHCARRCAATFPPPLPAPGAAGHRRTQCVRPTPEFRTPRARAEKAVRACGALYPRPGHARADARLPTPGVRAQPHALRLAPGTGFAPVSTGIVGGFSRTTLVRRPINTRTPWCFGRLPIFLNLYQ